ncbi:hypothetical protein [Sphingopyxis granuli]|uniref:hypothetical protein n=1 Tax=Sphingopyxis granuli TaxID=267128 RepID=UPI001BAF638F|nr:hypothetical protein [Sphingopyxis granuli]QUM74692.1 hypothetical protein ICN83_20550 [Sphingopyxis granuli]
MTDQYEPFDDDFDRQFIDATHPLYVSPASMAPAGFAPSGNDDLDAMYQTVAQRDPSKELGPWGKRFVYSWFALGAAYFGLIFIFGAH